MFAGAAREAVFSNPEITRRVNAEFIPVALKAAFVNNPDDGEEGRLYAEIGRSKPAPQGICVVNSDGKVLDWALMFDDNRAVAKFLDHALDRFRQHPDRSQPVPAERYMKFPSVKLADVADSGQNPPIHGRHALGQPCPAKPPLPPGTLTTRVYGRALGPDGKPMTDTIRQEHYVEDRFEVPVHLQEALARALSKSDADRIKVPNDLARALVSHAYLGQLDLDPYGATPGSKNALYQCELWVEKEKTEQGAPLRLRLEGHSEAAGGQEVSPNGQGGDGRIWTHDVKLRWEGVIEVRESRIVRLLLLASGSEKLLWSNAAFSNMANNRNDVARLPAGHFIDLACEVRYGFIGAPSSDKNTESKEQGQATDNAPPGPTPNLPPDGARTLMAMLGPQFAVLLPVVQDDLKLSQPQRQALDQISAGMLQKLQQVMQGLERSMPQERERQLIPFRERANKQVGEALSRLLKEEQQLRLRQIVLQQEGLFALGNPDIAARLNLTDTQREQFIRVIQVTQQRFEALQQRAQSGRAQGLQEEAARIRQEQEAQIERLLSSQQKQAWKALLGKRLPL